MYSPHSLRCYCHIVHPSRPTIGNHLDSEELTTLVGNSESFSIWLALTKNILTSFLSEPYVPMNFTRGIRAAETTHVILDRYEISP